MITIKINNVDITLTTHNVENAFLQFDSGKRPENYIDPKKWYVKKDSGEALYPAVTMWKLAIIDANGGVKISNEHLHEINHEIIMQHLVKSGYELYSVKKEELPK